LRLPGSHSTRAAPVPQTFSNPEISSFTAFAKHDFLRVRKQTDQRSRKGGATTVSSGQNHRITACSGLEVTSMGHPVQPPAEAGSPTAGCTGPCPGGDNFLSSGMVLRAACDFKVGQQH